jgi:hypothetical protein
MKKTDLCILSQIVMQKKWRKQVYDSKHVAIENPKPPNYYSKQQTWSKEHLSKNSRKLKTKQCTSKRVDERLLQAKISKILIHQARKT